MNNNLITFSLVLKECKASISDRLYFLLAQKTVTSWLHSKNLFQNIRAGSSRHFADSGIHICLILCSQLFILPESPWFRWQGKVCRRLLRLLCFPRQVFFPFPSSVLRALHSRFYFSIEIFHHKRHGEDAIKRHVKRNPKKDGVSCSRVY